MERLQKFIASCGVASRRKAEELITEGKVQVNGRRITELGVKIDPQKDKVKVNGQLLAQEKPVYYLLNKPKGVITSVSDPQGRETVLDYIKNESKRIYPVGRLDLYTEGLLLLTNDGELAQNLLKGVSLSDEILDESLFTESAFLLDPVSLSDGSKFGGVAYLLKDNIGAIYQTFKAKEPYFEMIEGLVTQLHDDYEMEPNRSYIVINDMLHVKLSKYNIPVECLTEGVASLRFSDFKEVDFGDTVEEQAEAVSQFLGGLAKESEKSHTTSSSLPSDEALRKDLVAKVLRRVDSDPDIRGEGFNFTSVLDEFGEAFYFEKSSDEKLIGERASLLYAFLCYLYPDIGGSHADYLSDKVCSVLHKEGIVAHIRLSDELRLAANTQIRATALNSDRAFAEIESKGLRLL